MAGDRFGRLSVIKESGRARGQVTWECLCDCGKTTVVTGYDLRSGNTMSCGCYRHQREIEANTTHGSYGTQLYRAYSNMKTRCYNPKYYLYQHYGGKGISVCDEWLGEKGFINFSRWAHENGYEERLSIDRIDNALGYSPQNCRWVDMTVQQNNRTNNRLITANGETHTAAEWARISNISYSTIYRRIGKGWSEADAVTVRPSHASSRNRTNT